MQWIELVATVSPDAVEKVASVLGKYGQNGAVIEEQPSEVSQTPTSLVKIYLPYKRSFKNTLTQITQEIAHLCLPVQLMERRLKPEYWMDSLKKHFGILEIGERFIIKPTWISQAFPPSTRTVIELDPGGAFGTGLHPTTRFCLLRLEKHLQPGMSVFDLGTGSGILAIAAAKLGASSVLAVDIDPIAVKTARGNIKANNVDPLIRVRRGTLSLRAQREFKNHFDIVLANITARAISDLAGGLAEVLKPGGILIVSGIHQAGLDEVLISLALADLSLEAVDNDGEWSAVVARKLEI
jgi:ribosomal protein L11 methyltransferase